MCGKVTAVRWALCGCAALLLAGLAGSTATAQERITLQATGGGVFSPDGKTVATLDLDRGDTAFVGFVRLSDVATGKELKTFKGKSGDLYNSVAFARDGKVLAVSVTALGPGNIGHSVRLLDAATGQERWSLPAAGNDPLGVEFLGDGRTLAVVDRQAIRLVDVTTGKEGKALTPAKFTLVAFSPDGKTLATDHLEGLVRLWDMAPLTERPFVVKAAHVRAFTPDGKLLATLDGVKDAVQLWDVGTGKEHSTLVVGKKVTCVAFSPDGKRLATGRASEPGEVTVWDRATGTELATFRGHKEGVVHVAFSPDGRVLASRDGTAVKLWDAPR